MTDYKYCYGPVGSWRLGVSLGVDPISQAEKVCDFDCVYCQLGHRAPRQPGRAVYLSPGDLGAELETIKAPADYITFSGRGEPTLAANLNDLRLECARHRPEKTAVITNASLIYSEEVRRELAGFDFVLAKLDAPDMELFREINRPADGISFGEILKGLILFSKGRRGRLAIQTMLIDLNKASAPELAALYARIEPDEVQLNTPLRPCAQKPLSRAEVELACQLVKAELKRLGKSGIKVISVYSEKHPEVAPVSAPDTMKRRGKV
ncbi:MAG: radical SAM protein [Elusimicrobiales bacterium]